MVFVTNQRQHARHSRFPAAGEPANQHQFHRSVDALTVVSSRPSLCGPELQALGINPTPYPLVRDASSSYSTSSLPRSTPSGEQGSARPACRAQFAQQLRSNLSMRPRFAPQPSPPHKEERVEPLRDSPHFKPTGVCARSSVGESGPEAPEASGLCTDRFAAIFVGTADFPASPRSHR